MLVFKKYLLPDQRMLDSGITEKEILPFNKGDGIHLQINVLNTGKSCPLIISEQCGDNL